MEGSGSVQNPTFLPQMTGIVELGSLWTWGALLLSGIAAFTSIVGRIRIVFLQRLILPIKSAKSDSEIISYDDDDTWSSCSSSDCGEISEESISDEEDDGETEASSSVDDEWRWSNRSDISLSEIGTSRDVVVKSWDEREENEETRFIWADGQIRFPVYPIVAAWDFEIGGEGNAGLPCRFPSESLGFALVGSGGRRRRVNRGSGHLVMRGCSELTLASFTYHHHHHH